jgi:hypothetical protein
MANSGNLGGPSCMEAFSLRRKLASIVIFCAHYARIPGPEPCLVQRDIGEKPDT